MGTHIDSTVQTLVKKLRKAFESTLKRNLTKTLANQKSCGKKKGSIFKKGSRMDPSNYRPISLLPLISKILEKIVHDQMIGYLA